MHIIIHLHHIIFADNYTALSPEDVRMTEIRTQGGREAIFTVLFCHSEILRQTLMKACSARHTHTHTPIAALHLNYSSRISRSWKRQKNESSGSQTELRLQSLVVWTLIYKHSQLNITLIRHVFSSLKCWCGVIHRNRDVFKTCETKTAHEINHEIF